MDGPRRPPRPPPDRRGPEGRGPLAAGLWNLFMPHAPSGRPDPVSNLDYAHLAEITGPLHRTWRPRRMNCAAPDTGNMEVLTLFGTPEQKEQWLVPAARGRDPLGVRDDRARRRLVRRHQHPAVASTATATSTCSTAASGGSRARRRTAARSSSSWARPTPTRRRHLQQSMILVPIDTPGRDQGPRPAGVRLPGPRGPRRDRLRGRAGAGDQPDRPGGRRLRDRPGPPRPRPHPPLHALHRRGRAGARADVPPGHPAGGVRRPARRTRASSASGSPTPASRSSRPACSRSRPPG